jgi:hypothetical protein
MFLIILSLNLISCNQVTEQQARIVLQKHLQERYGEPFEIEDMGIRSTDEKVWFEADIYPSRYKGTPKEYDEYYRSVGTVRIHKKWYGEELGTGGDVYFTVRLNENAAGFYKPKLDELFENNYLPVFKIDAWRGSENGDFVKTLERNKKEGYFYVEGGIYIFGRVENEKDREWYRTQIYEFVRFLKETGTFEYVNLPFYILDERCLTDKFENYIGNKLVEARNTIKIANEFIEYRKQQMNLLDNDYKVMEEIKKIEKINAYNRKDFLDMQTRQTDRINKNKYSVLYHTVISSPKYWENTSFIQNYKKLDYINISDIALWNSIIINYDQYDEKKLHNNEDIY